MGEILTLALSVSRAMAYLRVVKVQVTAGGSFSSKVLAATACMEELLASSGQRPEVLPNFLQNTGSLTNLTFLVVLGLRGADAHCKNGDDPCLRFL